jgi:hypothetical protein
MEHVPKKATDHKIHNHEGGGSDTPLATNKNQKVTIRDLL